MPKKTKRLPKGKAGGKQRGSAVKVKGYSYRTKGGKRVTIKGYRRGKPGGKKG